MKKVCKKMHVMAKIAPIGKLVKVVQKLRCARSQFSGGTSQPDSQLSEAMQPLQMIVNVST